MGGPEWPIGTQQETVLCDTMQNDKRPKWGLQHVSIGHRLSVCFPTVITRGRQSECIHMDTVIVTPGTCTDHGSHSSR